MGLLFDSDAPSNLTEFSVSELSGAIKRTVEQAFDQVRVRGEISGFKRSAVLRPCLFHAEGRQSAH